MIEDLIPKAAQIAIENHHLCIGTEHILLALMEDHPNPATSAIEKCGADLDDLRKALNRMIQKGPTEIEIEELILTPHLQEILALALYEIQEGNHAIPQEIILLFAILREKETVATWALNQVGITEKTFQQKLGMDFD
jgi:ATP-dependent Clp protease ATP-binding subunit ClpA